MGKEKPKVRRAMESRGERRRMENGRPQVTRAMENGRPEVRRAMESGGERREMENGGERPKVRRAMESGGDRRVMENGRPEVRRAMESGGERKAMENGGERKAMEDGYETMEELEEDEPILTKEMVMCSTCAGFVMRKKRTSIFYLGKDVVDVAEVVKEAEKMRDLMRAVLLHGPFQEKEPAEATKEQWWILRRKRRVMMETKRCPACSRSLLDRCPTCSHSLSEKPGPDEEGKAAGSKEKKKNSWEEGSELMAVLPSQGGEEGKKIAREDEAMVANAGSVKKSKQSREEGNGSSSGLKKKAKSEDKEGSGSKKKAKRSSEMEGSGPKETETEGSGSKEVKMKVRKSAGGNGKTKMVTRRLDKMSIDIIVKYSPPVKPYTYRTPNTFMERKFASEMAQYEVHCEFHEYLRCQSIIRGYAEYQEEVTDDEDE